MVTRQDIKTWTNNNKLWLEVTIDGDSYGISANKGAELVAIDNLVETLMKKKIGITKHDLMMVAYKEMYPEAPEMPSSR